MKEFSNLDQLIRSLTSIFYRFILILYGLIIYFNYSSFLNLKYFIVTILLYIILNYFLFGKNGTKSIVRIILDYIFIFLIVYGNPINDFFLISFILIPIINSPNHTGNKKSVLIYFLLSIVVFVSKNNSIINLIPILVFMLIGYAEYQRLRLRLFHDDIIEKIDDFFDNSLIKNKPHKIYNDIIDIFNFSSFKKLFIVERIFYFKYHIKKEHLVIINSSNFIYEYNCTTIKDLIKKNKKFYTNIKFEIDEKNIENNIVLIIDSNEINLKNIFLIEVKPTHLFVMMSLYKNLLISIFNKVIRKMNFENDLWQLKKNYLEEISKKREFISNAEYSVHYIKNKLGSIVSFIDIYEKIDDKFLDIDKRNKLLTVNDGVFKQMKIATNNIIERTAIILNKSENPFRIVDNEILSFDLFYSILVKELRETGLLQDVKFEFSNFDRVGSKNKIISFSSQGAESMFSLIVSNLNTHSNGDIKVIVVEDEHSYNIQIFNTINQKNIQSLENLCAEYNQVDTVRLMRLKSYGMEQIKDYLNQMFIESNLFLTDNNTVICQTFNLKKTNEKNSNF